MNRDYKIGSIEVVELIAMIVAFGIGFIAGYYTKYEIQEKERIGEITPVKETEYVVIVGGETPVSGGKLSVDGDLDQTQLKKSSKLWYINDKGISVSLPPIDELQFLEPEVGTVYCYEYLGDNKYDLNGIISVSCLK